MPSGSRRYRSRSPPPALPGRESRSSRSPPSRRYSNERGDRDRFSSGKRSLPEHENFSRGRSGDFKYTSSREESPPLDESTRPERTVFVTHLPQRFTDRQLCDFFENAGRIKSGKIVTDKLTGKSKGIAYVEFYTIVAAQLALKFNGETIDGFAIAVQPTQSNRLTTIEQATINARRAKVGSGGSASDDTKLFVRNLYCSLGEAALRRVFECYGRISGMQIVPDPKSSDFNLALIEYERWEDAKKALEGLDSFVLAANPIRVLIYNAKTVGDVNPFSGEINTSRSDLMHHFASRGSSAPSQHSSSCIQLQNMYDPSEETETNWEYDIANDVREECAKYGRVTHLHVAKNRTGDVFVRFADADAAQRVIEKFDGRWFGLRQIECKYVPENIYSDLFS